MWKILQTAFTPKNRLVSPIQLIYFVTDRCNAKCAHCFNWKELNQGIEDIAPAEFSKWVESMPQLQSLSLSGGEPFLRKDLGAIYRIANQAKAMREITIPTNGLMPDSIAAQIREMLVQAPGCRLNIVLSLDGLGDMHDEIRGVKGNFQKLYRTYQLISEIRKCIGAERLGIRIGTTLCNKNHEQIGELIQWVRANMPEADFHSFEIMRGNPMDLSMAPPSLERLMDLKALIFEAWEHYAFFGRGKRIRSKLALIVKKFVWEVYLRILQEKRQRIPCFAGTTSAVVDAKGNLFFCELREAIGNLREERFSTIWKSEKANSVRASIRRGECYCVHSCFQQKNVFLNAALWPSLIIYGLTGRVFLPPARHIVTQ